MTNINTLLDKADRVYHQLMGHRPQLENLLCKVNEAAPEKPQVTGDRWSLPRPPGWDTLPLTLPKAVLASDAALQLLFLCGASIWDSSLLPPFQDESGSSGGISSTSASVNRYILQLAQEYCRDCKNSFDELSKIIQVQCALVWIWVRGSLEIKNKMLPFFI